MLDPIEVDQRFATLKRALPCYSSRRMRLFRIVEFLETLLIPESRHLLPAYLDELIPECIASIGQTDFTGTNPKFLRRLLDVLDKTAASFQGHVSRGDWRDSRQKLAVWIERVESWAAEGGSEPVNRSTGNERGVRIPLVERERLLQDDIPRFGVIRLLGVDVQISPGSTGPDQLYIGRFAGNSGEEQKSLLPSIVAAKGVVSGIVHRNNIPRIRVSCNLDQPELLEGNSMEAGIAVGVVCDLLRELEHKEEFVLRHDVAITGRIDDSGRLLPVGEESLSVKVDACKYSPVQVLVVPKEQENAIAARGGGVKILGVSTLGEIFDNRRLTASQIIPSYRRVARKVRRWRRPLTAMLILGMSVALARIAYGPLDKNPVIAKWEGRTLSVENSNGQTVDRLTVGESTVFHATSGSAEYVSRDVAFADVNGDGINEVIWAHIPGDRSDDRSEVVCWSVAGQKELWRKAIGARFNFPENPSADSTMYRVTHISSGDFDRDGEPEVVLSANGGSFAAIVLKLDGKSGDRRDLYLHIGHLFAMEPFDLNGDGITEIVLTGTNNAFDEACIVILDPSGFSGCGPTRFPYEPVGIVPTQHRQYILVPRTIVGNAFRYLQRSNMGVTLSMHSEGGRGMLVGVKDVVGLDRSCFEETSAVYYIAFDSLVTPLYVNTGNNYDLLSRKLVEQGKIPFLPKDNPEYFRQYLQTLRYMGDDSTGAFY